MADSLHKYAVTIPDRRTARAFQTLLDRFFPKATERTTGTLDVGAVSATADELNRVADVSSFNRAVTATADGLTTGLLALTDNFVTVTSANANHIIMLPSAPAAALGTVIQGWVGTNGCEVRAAGTGATINGLDCKTTNEAALAATGYFKATAVGAEAWLLEYLTELGAVVTIVPDAV